MNIESPSLDLSSAPCPMDFVLLKKTLDSLPAGRNLEVRLKRDETQRDLVSSLSGCGYDIVSRLEEGDSLVLVVRRRSGAAAGFVPRPPRRGGGCREGNRRRR